MAITIKRNSSGEILLNRKDTAYVFSITPDSFRKWDVNPVNKIGREIFYDLKEVISYRLEKEKAKGQEGRTSLTDERIRLSKARADKLEIEVKVIEKNLLPANEVFDALSDMVMNFRAKILNLPARLTPQLVDETDLKTIEEIIRKHVYECLEECAEYLPEEEEKK